MLVVTCTIKCFTVCKPKYSKSYCNFSLIISVLNNYFSQSKISYFNKYNNKYLPQVLVWTALVAKCTYIEISILNIRYSKMKNTNVTNMKH